SLFYGVILGVFLVAFWIKWIGANAVFVSAIVSELLIIGIYNADIISFLWLNVIGALLVIGLASILQVMITAVKSADTSKPVV
ncbi:MAG: sodium:solute symporter, partial [Ferruginibacter sp.]